VAAAGAVFRREVLPRRYGGRPRAVAGNKALRAWSCCTPLKSPSESVFSRLLLQR